MSPIAGNIRRVFTIRVFALEKSGEGQMLYFGVIEAEEEEQARNRGHCEALAALCVLKRIDPEFGARLIGPEFKIDVLLHKLGAFALSDEGADLDGDGRLFRADPASRKGSPS